MAVEMANMPKLKEIRNAQLNKLDPGKAEKSR